MLKAALSLLALAFAAFALTAAEILPLPQLVPYALLGAAMVLALFSVMNDGSTKEL
jgi:NADH:ubiquinone oxidoreductase subunit 6 (subunit J)